MKINKKMLVLTTLICLLPIVAGVILYPQLPEQIAMHWGFDNEPNGWSSKAFAVFGLPGLMAALNLIMPLALKADPKNANMSPVLFNICWWIMPVVSVLCSAMTLGYALGYDVNIAQVIPAFVGVLFIVVGNYLPKTKQSYTMGIKLPWTLNSEENWNRTHRAAGFTWVAAGLLMLLSALLRLHGPTVTVVLLALAVGIPVLYSYLYYRRHEKGGAQ